MPQVSAELRWFFRETSKDEIGQLDAWFKNDKVPGLGGGKIRTDVYAIDVQTDELGVKNREGKSGIEVKALVDRTFLKLPFGHRVATAQLWSKVTSNVIALPSERARQRVAKKTRWLRKFDTSQAAARAVEIGAGKLAEDPLQPPPPDFGCNVEWTTIEVPDSATTWWTFGMEAFAFGPTADIGASLRDALQKTLAALTGSLGEAPEQTDAWLEQSYPAWVKALGGASASAA